MLKECREKLSLALKAAGIKTNIITTGKKLATNYDSHIGAVLFVKESLERDGSKKIYGERDDRKKRTRIFKRTVTFNIIIGERDYNTTEAIYERFLSIIGSGFYLNGDYIYLEVEESDWVDEEDSILKAKVAVQVSINCVGGMYKDTEYTKIEDILINVDKEAENERKHK